MQKLLTLWLSTTVYLYSASIYAQNYGLYNTFYSNPFLYNPAEALTEQTQVFIHHRQQWLAVEGAPTLSAITFNTLVDNTRVSWGGKVSSYSRGILTTNDAMLTYAYSIPVSSKNWLTLGLSGGVISNTIDMERVTDPNDPALATYLANNLQPIANVGMLYRSQSGINLGFSLPQMFPGIYNSETSFSNTTVTPADNIFVTLYYKRQVEGKIVTKKKGSVRKKVKTQKTTAPLEFYLNYFYSKHIPSQIELATKLNLSPHFWIGGAYRMPYGYSGNIGINAKALTLTYSYEPFGQPESGFSQGTHEVGLGLRIGSLRKLKGPSTVLKSTISTNTGEKHVARFHETTEDPDKYKEDTGKHKKMYYVVIRSFADFAQADAYRQKLMTEKFNAQIIYNPQDKRYYVHVLETSKAHEAHEEIRKLKNLTKLKDARLLQITIENH
jgi:type IX secretion system PorP/SprF family membrane protein